MPTGAAAPDEAAGGGGLVEQPAIAIANVTAQKEVRSFIGTGNIPWSRRIASSTVRFGTTTTTEDYRA